MWGVPIVAKSCCCWCYLLFEGTTTPQLHVHFLNEPPELPLFWETETPIPKTIHYIENLFLNGEVLLNLSISKMWHFSLFTLPGPAVLTFSKLQKCNIPWIFLSIDPWALGKKLKDLLPLLYGTRLRSSTNGPWGLFICRPINRPKPIIPARGRYTGPKYRPGFLGRCYRPGFPGR